MKTSSLGEEFLIRGPLWLQVDLLDCCHILPHAESEHGMFGMVTALVVQPATA
jgi:hypothetical protein